jgi:hypothetical protein
MKRWGDDEMAGWLGRLLGRSTAASAQAALMRRKEAQALIAECDRLDVVIAETRQRWAKSKNEI